MTVSRRTVTLGSLAAGLTIGTPYLAKAQGQKVVIALGGDGLHMAGIHLASRAGFFKEEGIDAELIDTNSGPRGVAAVMGGSALFSPIGAIHCIKANQEGGNLRALAGMLDVQDLFVVLSKQAADRTGARASTPIDERVRRLRGTRIGISSPGSSTDTYIRALFKARGMEPDKELQLLPLGSGSNMLAAFEQGRVDAFVWSAPQPQIAVARNLGEIIVNPFERQIPEIDGVPYIVMGVAGDRVKENSQKHLGCIRAMTKAYKFAKANPAEALNMMGERFPEFDKNVLAAVWPSYVRALPTTPVLSQAQFDKTQNWLNITAASPFTMTYDKVFSSEFSAPAARDLL